MPIDSNIREFIKRKGYITVDNLMREVLSANSASYYRNQNTIGSTGDFMTAPEISQLFGEIIGLWCIEQWEKIKPNIVSLVELGPGRGFLMRDILRTAKFVPEFYNSLKIELVEINPNFIEWQKLNLSQFKLEIRWLDKIDDISKVPTLIVANEFFDALPIKQYIKVKELWYESTFIIDPNEDKIKFDKIGLEKKLHSQLLHDHPEAKDGAILEESIESLNIIKFISEHIKKYHGTSLIIDYGYNINPLERTRYQYLPTLQAVKTHRYHPLLETLGEADLSAHVDFHTLMKTAKEHKIDFCEITSQHDFLVKYGILIRTAKLKKSLLKDKAEIIDHQVERLLSKKQMGELFKVLYLT